jgi:hypothetical protein
MQSGLGIPGRCVELLDSLNTSSYCKASVSGFFNAGMRSGDAPIVVTVSTLVSATELNN